MSRITVSSVVYVVSILLAVPSIFMAWGDKRPAGAFFESFVALIFYYGIGIGGLLASIFVGYTVAEEKKSNSLGWIAGLVSLVFATFSLHAATKIPGVGWRINKMFRVDWRRIECPLYP